MTDLAKLVILDKVIRTIVNDHEDCDGLYAIGAARDLQAAGYFVTCDLDTLAEIVNDAVTNYQNCDTWGTCWDRVANEITRETVKAAHREEMLDATA